MRFMQKTNLVSIKLDAKNEFLKSSVEVENHGFSLNLAVLMEQPELEIKTTEEHPLSKFFLENLVLHFGNFKKQSSDKRIDTYSTSNEDIVKVKFRDHFTVSDFGRTIGNNGDGTDHA